MKISSENITQIKCQPCEGGIPSLNKQEVNKYLKLIPKWQVNSEYTNIIRTFDFKGFYKTMAFVNAVAWIANSEGHHPDLEVSYNKCTVKFTTHAILGLSDNDFICAAKIDKFLV